MTQTVQPYTPRTGPLAKILRRLVQYRTAAPIREDFERPVVSFTFDDFPASAARAGAEILEDHGARGTFYAATGLFGKDTVSGRVVTAEEVRDLFDRGHEIGAHSHGHFDFSNARPDTLGGDIDKNLAALSEVLGQTPIPSFAFPYGEARVALKKQLAERFRTSRGILGGINRKRSDRMQLRAVELSPEAGKLERAHRMLEAVARRPGWLVFFTHDVSPDPSAYGITPENFRQLVGEVRRRGYEILPVGQVGVR